MDEWMNGWVGRMDTLMAMQVKKDTLQVNDKSEVNYLKMYIKLPQRGGGGS